MYSGEKTEEVIKQIEESRTVFLACSGVRSAGESDADTIPENAPCYQDIVTDHVSSREPAAKVTENEKTVPAV